MKYMDALVCFMLWGEETLKIISKETTFMKRVTYL